MADASTAYPLVPPAPKVLIAALRVPSVAGGQGKHWDGICVLLKTILRFSFL